MPNLPNLQDAAVIFPVADVAAAVAYYRDVLGFTVAFTWGDPATFAGVCRGAVTIHLNGHANPRSPPGTGGLNIFVDDVDALQDELRGNGACITRPAHDTEWGMRNLELTDLDGNYLSFGMESRGGAR